MRALPSSSRFLQRLLRLVDRAAGVHRADDQTLLREPSKTAVSLADLDGIIGSQSRMNACSGMRRFERHHYLGRQALCRQRNALHRRMVRVMRSRLPRWHAGSLDEQASATIWIRWSTELQLVAPASDREQHPLGHPRREGRLRLSRRLSRWPRCGSPPQRSDWQRSYGHPLPFAESFVNSASFARALSLRGRQLALSRRLQGLRLP